jgi:hypothetical protein
MCLFYFLFFFSSLMAHSLLYVCDNAEFFHAG